MSTRSMTTEVLEQTIRKIEARYGTEERRMSNYTVCLYRSAKRELQRRETR